MHGSTVIKLLSSFTAKEIKEFGEFLRSPYFNKRKAVVKLYDFISRAHPAFVPDAISKEKIFSRLFPGKKYNDGTLRVLSHYLFDLAEKFTAYKSFENSAIDYNTLLVQGLVDRKQYKLAEKRIISSINEVKESGLTGERYYESIYRLETEYLHYLEQVYSGVYEKFLDKADFTKVYMNLNRFYLISMMKTYVNLLNLKQIYRKDFNDELFRRAIKNFDIEPYKDEPLIEIYYYLIKMLTEGDNREHFEKLRTLKIQNKKKLTREDLVDININMENFCHRKIRSGDDTYFRELFNIYNEELKEETYREDAYMTPIFFKNVVLSGLKVEENEWVKKFIYDYKDYIRKEYREGTFGYCLALYEYKKKNYEKSLELLTCIKFDELYLKIDSKTLQMLLFYEMNSLDALQSALDAFRHFIANNKLIPENRKPLFLNFYRYTNKLLSHRFNASKSNIEFLRNSLKKEPMVVNKDWLLQKYDELIKG
jgi:hypothetical protein